MLGESREYHRSPRRAEFLAELVSSVKCCLEVKEGKGEVGAIGNVRWEVFESL